MKTLIYARAARLQCRVDIDCGLPGRGEAMLNANSRRDAAGAVLMALAMPALLYGLFIALMAVPQPRWN
jgi:hypothetical protein